MNTGVGHCSHRGSQDILDLMTGAHLVLIAMAEPMFWESKLIDVVLASRYQNGVTQFLKGSIVGQ